MNVRTLEIIRYKDGVASREPDEVAVEAELAVIVDGARAATLLRLPPESEKDAEENVDLALGWLFTEGLIASMDDVAAVRPGAHGELPAVIVDRTASARGRPVAPPAPVGRVTPVAVSALMKLKAAFESRKSVQPRTGAAHSAVVFDREFRIIAQAEDIGRHNALDKVCGQLLRAGKIGDVYACVMSSRQSREIAAKAARLGAEIQVGVSTVTTLAVELAQAQNMTLIGFFRQGRMNVYAHPERIDFSR